ncbi:ATP-binding cassette sub- G member 2 [Gaertneriomyces sp. JEL0708]|nr:ATP-binding cassette sub- G member 2 [Gaertneriomyces sp. JEL0708]
MPTDDIETPLEPMKRSGRTGSLVWSNLNYSIDIPKSKGEDGKPVRRALLKGINGEAKRGEMVAIMGSSGAGKTTLLNCLSGRLGVGYLEGSITLNGRVRDRKSWKRMMAFVEQDDQMYTNLTVQETIRYAARLRLPSSEYTEAQKIEHADSILKSLRLSKAKDTPIGDGLTRGVSGGERKRTAIGQELVGNPDILFLDEPTSGLDSNSALAVMRNVKADAMETGRIVVVTIHQPSFELLSLFDRVVLLSAGYTAYYGSVEAALDHFEGLGYPLPPKKNPADFFMDLLTIAEDTAKEDMARVEKLRDAYLNKEKPGMPLRKESIKNSGEPLEIMDASGQPRFSTWGNHWFKEFSILFGRSMLDVTRSRPLIIAGFGRTIVLILLMGFSFFQLDNDQRGVQNRIGILFLWPINQFFITIQPIVLTFPIERAIMLRERSAGSYRVSTFYVSKVLAVCIPSIIYSGLASIPLYWMIGLQPVAGKFFGWLLVCTVEVLTACALGTMISSVSPTLQFSMAVAPMLAVVFLLFGGNVINNDSLGWWFRWLHYVSPIGYAYTALMQFEFRGLTLTCQEGYGGCYQRGEEVLQTQALDDISSPWLALPIMGALAFWWFAMGYVFLRLTSKPKTKLL